MEAGHETNMRGGETMNKWPLVRRISAGFLMLAAGCVAWTARLAAGHAKTKVLGLDRVIAFTYTPSKFDLKQLHSVTLVGPVGPLDWKDWQGRNVVAGVGHTWADLLRSPLEKAVSNLTEQDFGGNPRPVVMIDEFGFDYGGNIDQRSAELLREVKRKKPDLALAVFDMRGPVAPVLAEAYRDAADLVMMESYVAGPRQYWLIAFQAWSARRYGILPKTIFILGLGKGGNPGENWAESKEEIERQIRFVRLIAPESPGIGFFGGTPELVASADAVCARLSHIPTNGSGLPAEALDIAKTFRGHYSKPTLLVSPSFVGPNFTADAKQFADPRTMRVYVINLGDEDATNVRMRLRDRPELGGNVFAEGAAPVVPKHDAAIAVLPITGHWQEWVGEWVVEVDAPGSDVVTFKPEPPGK